MKITITKEEAVKILEIYYRVKNPCDKLVTVENRLDGGYEVFIE